MSLVGIVLPGAQLLETCVEVLETFRGALELGVGLAAGVGTDGAVASVLGLEDAALDR